MMEGDILTAAEVEYIEALEDLLGYVEEALFQGTLDPKALVVLVENINRAKDRIEE